MMKEYLNVTGERLVAACNKAMTEEAKRAGLLALMPKNAPGYDALDRDFALDRIREQQGIEKILKERDQKLAKHTRFTKHIPAPVTDWDDNEQWINAVIERANQLGIDTKVRGVFWTHALCTINHN